MKRKWSLVLLLGVSFQRIRNAHVNQISLDPFTRIFQTKNKFNIKTGLHILIFVVSMAV